MSDEKDDSGESSSTHVYTTDEGTPQAGEGDVEVATHPVKTGVHEDCGGLIILDGVNGSCQKCGMSGEVKELSTTLRFLTPEEKQ